jgi:CheY-like chemotaxis protein
MEHILVVDDAVTLASLFQEILEENGYRVKVAHDGVAALRMDENDPADAVITDLTMPRMGGRELVERLRERRPELPAVIVSGYTGDENLSGRQTVVFAKPVSLALLTRRLGEMLVDARTERNPDF